MKPIFVKLRNALKPGQYQYVNLARVECFNRHNPDEAVQIWFGDEVSDDEAVEVEESLEELEAILRLNGLMATLPEAPLVSGGLDPDRYRE